MESVCDPECQQVAHEQPGNAILMWMLKGDALLWGHKTVSVSHMKLRDNIVLPCADTELKYH